jgi:hypothetical protein
VEYTGGRHGLLTMNSGHLLVGVDFMRLRLWVFSKDSEKYN